VSYLSFLRGKRTPPSARQVRQTGGSGGIRHQGGTGAPGIAAWK